MTSVSYSGIGTNTNYSTSYDNSSDKKRYEREQKIEHIKQKSVQKIENSENNKRLKKLFKNPAFKFGVCVLTFGIMWLTGKGLERHFSKSGEGKKTYLTVLGSIGDAITNGFTKAIDWLGKKCKWFKRFTHNVSSGYSNMKTKVSNWAKNNKFFSCFVDPGKESHATFSLAKTMEGGVSYQYINEINDVFLINPFCGKSDGRVWDKSGKMFVLARDTIESLFNKYCGGRYLDVNDLVSKAANGVEGARKDFDSLIRKIYKDKNLKGKWCYGSLNSGQGFEYLKTATSLPQKISCLWNGFIQLLTGRKCNFDTAIHKLDVIQGADNIAKTKLGKGLAKTGLFATEAIFNNTAGWFGSMAIQAYALSSVIEDTVTADKEDRGKVLAESAFREIGSLITLGFSTKVINKFASLRGIGMSAEQFQALQNQTNYINNTIFNGEKFNATASKSIGKWQIGGQTLAEAHQNLKALQKLEKGALKWYEYPIKWIGHICHWGRGRVRPVETGFLGGIKKFFTYTIPGFIGGLGRGLVGMYVIDDKKTKFLEYIPHKLFGKPKDRSEIAQRDALMEEQQRIHENKVIIEELAGRLSQHPELRELIQKSPELQKAIDKDLSLLVAMLDEADEKKKQAEFQKQQNRIASLQRMSSYTTQGQNQNVAYA